MQSEHFHQELTPVSEALRAAEVSLPWSASRITGRIIPIFLLHLHLLLPLDTAACFALPCSTMQWVLSQLWLLFHSGFVHVALQSAGSLTALTTKI